MTRTIVVGGGGAGAALASRLSEDPSREVMLIEAGDTGPTPEELLDGGVLPAAVPGHAANWGHKAQLFPGVETIVPRGRVLGGSTAINGGYFVRARPADFARWALAGGEAWSFARALPVLAAMERDLDFGAAPGHGDRGPMPVARPALTGPLAAAFRAAALELGFSEEPDKNAAHPAGAPGIGPVPSNIVGGRRINTALAYLQQARDRPNLRIVGNTQVHRVRLAGGRAIGVSTEAGDIDAAEVVLCAGAVTTPHLLMLSGIGPADHLAAHGIPVVADLPVGEAFSDHPNVAVGWHPRTRVHEDRERFAFPAALNFDSSGPAARFPDGDLEVLLMVKPIGELFAGASGAAPSPSAAEMQLLVALQQPRGRGRLSLRSADPLVAPRIDYRYLAQADDRARLRVGVRTAAALLSSRAFAPIFARFRSLNPHDLADDAALDGWIRSHLGTAIHLSGTAPMGSVVDGGGRVHGISGLRVADTSMLPTVPARGPFNSAVFIGELIARQMRDPATTR